MEKRNDYQRQYSEKNLFFGAKREPHYGRISSGDVVTISWIILTFNRPEKLVQSFRHNVENAGAQWDELIWIDNGSKPELRQVMDWELKADIKVFHKTNTGVARGYNSGLVMATKDYIVITGMDMLMPKDWLKTFKTYIETIPNTGVATMYHRPLEAVPERIRGPAQVINGLSIVPAMPIERRIFKRSLLKDFGYFHEGFGLYGYDDLAWAGTVERVCQEKGLLSYVIPGHVAHHLGTEGYMAHDGKDDTEYHAMKSKEVRDPEKGRLLGELGSNGYPKFDPWM